MVGAVGKAGDAIVPLEHVGDGKDDRKRRRLFHVFKEMRCIGGKYHPSSSSSHANALQAHGVAAKQMYGHPGGDLPITVMKHDPSLEGLSDQVAHVIRRVRRGERAARHVRARREVHLSLLQVEVGLGEVLDRTGMVVVQVCDDDVAHLGTINPEHGQSVARGPFHGAAAPLALGLIETDIHHN